MKKLKRVLIICGILVVVMTISITLFNIIGNPFFSQKSTLDTMSKKITPVDLGRDMKEVIETDNKSVVAYFEDEAIYENELIYAKFINEISYASALKKPKENQTAKSIKLLDDNELLLSIIKDRLIIKEASKAGINYTIDDAISKLKVSRENRQKLIEAGHEETIKSVKDEDAFLNSLGMNEEEYILTIGAQFELKYMIIVDYMSYYYNTESEKVKNNPDYKMKDFDSHINEFLKNADYEFVK